MTGRSKRGCVVVLVSALMMAGCGVVPHKKGEPDLAKVAVETDEIELIIERYRDVRNSAIELLDPNPLSTVSGDAVLAIDSGSFEVSQRAAGTKEIAQSDLQIIDVFAPKLDEYSLWFGVTVEDRTRDVIRFQIFERERASDPWLLVSTPEVLPTTELPEVRRDGDTAVTVGRTTPINGDMSAERALAAYIEALNDPSSTAADSVAEDGFRRLIRDGVAASSSLEGVEFTQSWGSSEVDYALRTDNGGALVFATLTRQDRYVVEEGLAATWPDGSPQQAFLGAEISSSGTLNFLHQILLFVPDADDELPRVLGQFGGVVSGETDGASP